MTTAETTGATEVSTSAAADLLARLYVAAHVARSDFEQLPDHVDLDVPVEWRDVWYRYFGDDFSLGMNLLPAAVQHGWRTTAALLEGVRALSGDGLAHLLLASTTLESKDAERTAEQVAVGLADAAQRHAAARRIARRNAFLAAHVEYVLDDPDRAHGELLGLLEHGAALPAATPSEGDVPAEQEAAVHRALAAMGRQRALLELTGGWTLRSDEQPVALVVTPALGPLVITRLLPDGRILVAFGRPERPRERSIADLAAVARALSSEQRIAILRYVAQEPASGQTLAKALDLTQATVHYHTALLRSTGLITSSRDVHSVLHALNAEGLTASLGALGRTILDAVDATGDPS